MKLLLLALISFVATAGECCDDKNTSSKDCKGEARKDCICTQQYDPVCGCDGKTYGNSCEAQCQGLKEWTKGECPK